MRKKQMLKQILFSLLMATPAIAQPVASDGYVFKGSPPAVRKDFRVIIEEYNTRNELVKGIQKYGVAHGDVHAFAVIDPNKNTCTIHIIRPAKRYMPEHMGHELTHCIYGGWHK
jgi:hypothetical protein